MDTRILAVIQMALGIGLACLGVHRKDRGQVIRGAIVAAASLFLIH